MRIVLHARTRLDLAYASLRDSLTGDKAYGSKANRAPLRRRKIKA